MSISKSGSFPAWLEGHDIRLGDGGTLPERIAARIAELIEDGVLAPGERLPSERELARSFGVGRLAVREAAHRLEARGLVVVRRGAGCFVAAGAAPAETVEAQHPAAVDVDELADVRLLLEPAAADWAARRAQRSSVALLLRILERFEAAAAGPEPRFDLAGAADVELHLEIAHAADNALLARFVEQIQHVHGRRLEWGLRQPGRLEAVAAEHRRIVEAIAAGDPAAAREAMAAHLVAAAASIRTPAGAESAPD